MPQQQNITPEACRALVLFGSPRREGHTGRLLQAFLEALPFREGIAFIEPFREPVAPCDGCGYCRNHDGCMHQDIDRFDALLRQASLLVVATPVYNLSFPAPLKALFDRTQRYFSDRFYKGMRPPIAKPKQGVLLLTAGSQEKAGEDIIQRQLTMIFSILNTTLCETVEWLGTDSDKNGGDQALLAAACAARRLSKSGV